MVSGFICLERFAPITLGIDIFNIAFIAGMNAAAPGSGMATESLTNIKTGVLPAGFEAAFVFGCVVSIVLLAVALPARQEIHPDYRPVPGGMGMQKKG